MTIHFLPLTQKGVSFKTGWGTAQQIAFDNVKNTLSTTPVLARLDSKLPLQVACDASGHGLGAVLNQNGKRVCCASRSLIPAEKNYSATELECLAVVFAYNKFRHHLEFHHSTVKTDHQALMQIIKHPGSNPRLTRWSLLLSSLDMTIDYRKGKLSRNVDCLSRYPNGPPEINRTDDRSFIP